MKTYNINTHSAVKVFIQEAIVSDHLSMVNTITGDTFRRKDSMGVVVVKKKIDHYYVSLGFNDRIILSLHYEEIPVRIKRLLARYLPYPSEQSLADVHSYYPKVEAEYLIARINDKIAEQMVNMDIPTALSKYTLYITRTSRRYKIIIVNNKLSQIISYDNKVSQHARPTLSQ